MREGVIRAVRIKVADPQIGADVDVIRIELQRSLVGVDRVGPLLGVEIGVSELRVIAGVLRVLLNSRL